MLLQISLLAALALAVTSLSHAKARAAAPADAPRERSIPVGLPPLAAGEAADVRRDAEECAVYAALGGVPRANPHTPGTRAWILWETSFHATVLHWQEDVG